MKKDSNCKKASDYNDDISLLEVIAELLNSAVEEVLKDLETEKSEENKRILPSERNIPFDKKEYYYKLVQEYIDQEVKPYNSDKEKVNDEFAKIFEFVCWLYNK